MFKKRTLATSLVSAAAIASLVLVGCSKTDPDQVEDKGKSDDASAQIQKQERNDDLRKRLPQDVLDEGKLVSVNSGSFPPYEIVGSDGDNKGASTDLLKALSELWDVKIEDKTVDGLSSVLTGISADRYQMGFGPIGDFKDRQDSNDFVDYVQEFVVFAVEKGNPKEITDLDSTCGTKIAVQAGGSAEKVIKDQAQKCVDDGEDKVEVMSFKDQPQSILAVQSGRADAFFSSQAPLTYFVEESKGKLELAGTGQDNGFDTLYQGAVVKKDSDLGPVLKDSLQELFDNGTYEQIMKKWNLKDNMIDKPDFNLAVS
jgi:polar amino acid transport system substrate-binding protein